MRYAITYLTNKIVDAENRDLTLDEKLRIICPACQHPLTYVEPIRSARHFRHPRRSGSELLDPDLQCEARVSQISEQAVRTYNRIIDQTNMQLFQRHFFRILATALSVKDADPQNMSNLITATKAMISTKEAAVLLEEVDQYCEEYYNNILAEKPEISATVRTENKKRTFRERCAFIRDNIEKTRETSDDCVARLKLEIENAIEPGNRVLRDMIIWYDNEGHKEYSESILEEYWNLISGVMNMLAHKKSTLMRHFAYALSTQLIIKKMIDQGEDANWDDRSSINYLMSRYMMTALQPLSEREEPLHQIAKGIDILLREGTGLDDYLTSIGVMMTTPEPDRWLNAVNQVDASDAWKDYNGKSGFIYIAFNRCDDISSINRVKIGKAKDIEKRHSNYQTYSPDGFEFFNVFSVSDRHGAERYIQRKLKDHQIKGGGGQEWYSLTLEEADTRVQQCIYEYSQEVGFFGDKIHQASSRGFG